MGMFRPDDPFVPGVSLFRLIHGEDRNSAPKIGLKSLDITDLYRE
jgi:hypothetical protein